MSVPLGLKKRAGKEKRDVPRRPPAPNNLPPSSSPLCAAVSSVELFFVRLPRSRVGVSKRVVLMAVPCPLLLVTRAFVVLYV